MFFQDYQRYRRRNTRVAGRVEGHDSGQWPLADHSRRAGEVKTRLCQGVETILGFVEAVLSGALAATAIGRVQKRQCLEPTDEYAADEYDLGSVRITTTRNIPIFFSFFCLPSKMI